MSQLIAVTTTGIYCRAGCAARQPKPENTTTYGHPATAEANGFRACLRCRPDRELVEPLDEHVPKTVRQAFQLINDGFLDHNLEAALASAVGYEVRQLRRLFASHIGASPSQLASSRRAHFARLLLDETDLDLSAIAAASGFRSERHCRRIIKQTFAFSPSQLRKRRRTTPPLLDGGIELAIAAPDGHASSMLRFLQPRATPHVEIVHDGSYRRVVQECGHLGIVEVSEATRGLAVKAHLPSFHGLIDFISRIRNLFGLTNSTQHAMTQLKDDPVLGPALATYGQPVIVAGAWDRFETAIRIIVGQHISVAGASTATGQLAKACGTPAPHSIDYGLSHFFPTAEQLAAADFGSVGMPKKRKETLRLFAEAITTGQLSLQPSAASLDEMTAVLESLKGIGPWTSNMISLRAFGNLDAFPASDLGIRKGLTHLLDSNTLVSQNQTEQIAEHWRPYRGVAATILWHAARTKQTSASDQTKKAST